MAYVVPTPAELKALFPAFAAVGDSTVQAWLDRAQRVVDESWLEDDFEHALMLLACHYMVTNGIGAGAEAEAAAAGASGFKTMRSGSLTLERFDRGAAASEFDGTQYGQQFLPLLRRNKGGPRTAAIGVLPRGTFYPWGC